MDFPGILDAVNSVLWVIANILLAYSAVALIVFLIAYYAIFDPRATTGGKLIFRFMLSLVGAIALSFIGVFVDPAHNQSWMIYPGMDEVEWWRPVIRVGIYGFVAFSITSLAKLLVYRKWFPHKLKKASDINLVAVRHTNEIPIIPIKRNK